MNVSFDMGSKIATVTYDPSVADPNDIRTAIDRADRSMISDDEQADEAARALD